MSSHPGNTDAPGETPSTVPGSDPPSDAKAPSDETAHAPPPAPVQAGNYRAQGPPATNPSTQGQAPQARPSSASSIPAPMDVSTSENKPAGATTTAAQSTTDQSLHQAARKYALTGGKSQSPAPAPASESTATHKPLDQAAAAAAAQREAARQYALSGRKSTQAPVQSIYSCPPAAANPAVAPPKPHDVAAYAAYHQQYTEAYRYHYHHYYQYYANHPRPPGHEGPWPPPFTGPPGYAFPPQHHGPPGAPVPANAPASANRSSPAPPPASTVKPAPPVAKAATPTGASPSPAHDAANTAERNPTAPDPPKPAVEEPKPVPPASRVGDIDRKPAPAKANPTKGPSQPPPRKSPAVQADPVVAPSVMRGVNILPDPSLGHLARKFRNLLEATTSGTLDLKEAANNMQVPKKRLDEIVDVLEGAGLVERWGKHSIVWTGTFGSSFHATMAGAPTESALGDGNNDVHAAFEKTTAKVDHYYREEAMLDSWIHILKSIYEKQQRKAREHTTTTLGEGKEASMPLNFLLGEDIIEALYYPIQPENPPKGAVLVVPPTRDPATAQTPQSCVIAIQAPANSIARAFGQPQARKYSLQIAEKTDLEKVRDEMKRKAEEEANKPPDDGWRYDVPGRKTKRPRVEVKSPIQIYLLPTEYDPDRQKIVSVGAKLIPTKEFVPGADEATEEEEDDPTEVEIEPEWAYCMEELRDDEGVADFFG